MSRSASIVWCARSRGWQFIGIAERLEKSIVFIWRFKTNCPHQREGRHVGVAGKIASWARAGEGQQLTISFAWIDRILNHLKEHREFEKTKMTETSEHKAWFALRTVSLLALSVVRRMTGLRHRSLLY